MKTLIIIGAGGFGRDLYFIVKESLAYNKEYNIKGFLDDNLEALSDYSGYPPIIGDISSYRIQESDVFICSIGHTKRRQEVYRAMAQKGGNFMTIIHNTARVASSAYVGAGSIIGPFVSIGANAVVGANCLIQTGTIIGHDVKVGDNSRIDNYSIIVGGVKIESNCSIHSNSVINANITIGEDAIVGACSFVIKNVPSATSVYGNPAKRLF